jgi:hypothetical protein
MADLQHPDPVWTSLRRSADDARPPAPFVISLTLAALIAWVGLAGLIPLPDAVTVVGVLVVAGCASWWITAVAGLVVAGISFLVVDGFVQGEYGNLTWNGAADALLLVLLVLVCLGASEARRELVEVRARRGLLKKP